MYLLLKGCDDGTRVTTLFDADVIRLLQDSTGSYGIKEFMDFDWFRKNPDPAYWPEGVGVLIKFDGVTIPKEVVSRHWVIE